MAGDILVAKRTAALVWRGRQVIIKAGETFARAGHPILDVYGDEFEPVFVHFDVDDSGKSAPVEQRTTEPPKEEKQLAPQPDPKAVRAWAADNGIDVPPRGKLPDHVVAQYLAAQK
ncbi:Lsr2 family DNA-binding protein [Streptomyces sp. CPS1]